MLLAYILPTFGAWRRYHACVRELSQLSDLELADIGVSRSEILSVARRSARDYLVRPGSTPHPPADPSRNR